MRIHPSEATRLDILNRAEPRHPWKSVKEKRQCILCHRIFTGREVVIRWARKGATRVSCPNLDCESAQSLWVRPGNPLLNEHLWQEWELAMASFADRDLYAI